MDDAESLSPSSKRARRSSDEPDPELESEPEPEPEPGPEHESDQKSVIDEGEPSPAQTLSSTSPALHPHPFTCASNEAVNKSSDGSDSSDSEHSNHHGRVPSGVEGFYFHDLYSLPSPTREHPSGIERLDNPSPAPFQNLGGVEGHRFPDSHDISPSSPIQYPSGIEGYSFPDNYDITLSSSRRVPSGIEGYHSPDYYDIEYPPSPPSSSSKSTLMGSPPTMPPEEVQKSFKRQNHFYDDPGAIERGDAIITGAREILARLRGSPTAKDKVLPLIEVAKEYPILSEDEFASNLLAVLLDEARMVLKADVPYGKAPTSDDFEPDPQAWKSSYLGTRAKAHFRSDSIPQAVPTEASFEKIFNYYPRLQTPRPDIMFGLSAELLPDRYCAVFDNVIPKPLTKGVHYPFLAGEFKTKDRPIAEAQIQCQRTGSAIVAYSADWTDVVNGKARAETLTSLPEVDMEKETSSPDQTSFYFTIAIAPNCCFMYVNWREVWSNGAVFWHTNVLDQYSLEYGMKPAVEKFQRHISNNVDWGIGERAAKIYEQTRALSKRKTGKDNDLPPIEPKKQRTGSDISAEAATGLSQV